MEKNMIGQMSKKSKIYHRSGCRFIKRIDAESLITFDFDDLDISKLEPCKCCCNLKKMYEEYKPKLRTVFADLDIATEFEDGYIKVETPWYKWRISLKQSSQNMKLYQEEWNEDYQSISLIKCDDLEKTKKLSTVMKFIANEEKVAAYPVQYRKQAIQIEQFARKNNIQIEYDGSDLYIITDIAAWKIAYGYHFDWFKLLHCPFDGEGLTMEQVKEAHYHVQKDVPRNQSPLKHLQYIAKHDAAKKIERIDYRKLPQKTKKQKKYYRQAKNRAIRKSANRVIEILAELEVKGELKETRMC